MSQARGAQHRQHLKSCTPCAKWHRSPILHLCVNVNSVHSSNLCAPNHRSGQMQCYTVRIKQHRLVDRMTPAQGNKVLSVALDNTTKLLAMQ